MQALKQEQTKRSAGLPQHRPGRLHPARYGCLHGPAARIGPAATALAALALIGALFHVLNHGVFKALLFLNAGSMLHATGTQDLNKMGGLLKYMPLTAVTALVASLSISGVPLFNGFASKWTIYVASRAGKGVRQISGGLRRVAILTSALTLASFVKFFGVSFLSRTSALVKEQAAVQAARSGLVDANAPGGAGADLRSAGSRAGGRLSDFCSARWRPADMVLARSG